MHHAYTSAHLQHVHLFIYNIHVYMYTSTCTTYMYNTCTTYMYTCTPLHVQHTCTTYMYNIHVYMYTSSCTTYMYNIHVQHTCTTYMYTCTTYMYNIHVYMYNIHVQHVYMYNMYTCTPLHVQHTSTTCTPTPNTHVHNRWRSGTKPTQRRENKEECFLPLTTPASCRTPETSASLRPNVELMRTLYPDINNSFKQLRKQLSGSHTGFFPGRGEGRCVQQAHACTHWVYEFWTQQF